MRRIHNAGDGIQTPDMPFRFLPCITAGLAYYIAMKIPEGTDRLPINYLVIWGTLGALVRDRPDCNLWVGCCTWRITAGCGVRSTGVAADVNLYRSCLSQLVWDCGVGGYTNTGKCEVSLR